MSQVLDYQITELSDINIKVLYNMLVARGIEELNTYKAFHPIVRVRSHINKMHVTKLVHYSRLIYLNPIEGVLISYKTANKFPHQHHNIMQPLNPVPPPYPSNVPSQPYPVGVGPRNKLPVSYNGRSKLIGNYNFIMLAAAYYFLMD